MGIYLQTFLEKMQIGNEILICPYCGQLTKIVWVHGHGQCMICKTNFDECCRGENNSVDENNENVEENNPNNNRPEHQNEQQPENEKK